MGDQSIWMSSHSGHSEASGKSELFQNECEGCRSIRGPFSVDPWCSMRSAQTPRISHGNEHRKDAAERVKIPLFLQFSMHEIWRFAYRKSFWRTFNQESFLLCLSHRGSPYGCLLSLRLPTAQHSIRFALRSFPQALGSGNGLAIAFLSDW